MSDEAIKKEPTTGVVTTVSTDTPTKAATPVGKVSPPNAAKEINYNTNPKIFQSLLITVLVLVVAGLIFYAFDVNERDPHHRAARTFLIIALVFGVAGIFFTRLQFSGIRNNITKTGKDGSVEKHTNYDFFANFYILFFGLALVFLIIGVVVWLIYPLKD